MESRSTRLAETALIALFLPTPREPLRVPLGSDVVLIFL